ncbi:hypothetical protein BD324DRAFT_627717 [Kockovaella imperatae]|uniref:Zn(2)-C6 fungal-type domain-containing protein n=1 Tax=Kockovaella imperatae TaxID=4999 RepID=A0A1Y1UFU6_9TREE|nr:hypothetical protein BD324DRAFT_627717 [Kockovaella imperatae]ORX36923.1 hypothetical protein BD324DRAFT_627717 [Kockovaella imperatae]
MAGMRSFSSGSSRACIRCSGRKRKCDRVRPACGECVASKHICEYSSSDRRRGPPAGQARAIEARVKDCERVIWHLLQLEGVIQALKSQDANGETLSGCPLHRHHRLTSEYFSTHPLQTPSDLRQFYQACLNAPQGESERGARLSPDFERSRASSAFNQLDRPVLEHHPQISNGHLSTEDFPGIQCIDHSPPTHCCNDDLPSVLRPLSDRQTFQWPTMTVPHTGRSHWTRSSPQSPARPFPGTTTPLQAMDYTAGRYDLSIGSSLNGIIQTSGPGIVEPSGLQTDNFASTLQIRRYDGSSADNNALCNEDPEIYW